MVLAYHVSKCLHSCVHLSNLQAICAQANAKALPADQLPISRT